MPSPEGGGNLNLLPSPPWGRGDRNWRFLQPVSRRGRVRGSPRNKLRINFPKPIKWTVLSPARISHHGSGRAVASDWGVEMWSEGAGCWQDEPVACCFLPTAFCPLHSAHGPLLTARLRSSNIRSSGTTTTMPLSLTWYFFRSSSRSNPISVRSGRCTARSMMVLRMRE